MRDEEFKNAVISAQDRTGQMFLPSVKPLLLDSVYLGQLMVKQSRIVGWMVMERSMFEMLESRSSKQS